MQNIKTPANAIEAETGSALRSAMAWGSGEWLGLTRIRDRMAGEVIAELAATEEGCEAITKALSTWRKAKHQQAVGAIWSLSDAWVKLISKEIEHAADQINDTTRTDTRAPCARLSACRPEDAQAIFATAARCMSAS